TPPTTAIICATDAGREGQHIFDLIYQLTRSTKPVQRLWISSLTAEAIRAGFRTLKPMSAFASLSAAAAWAGPRRLACRAERHPRLHPCQWPNLHRRTCADAHLGAHC